MQIDFNEFIELVTKYISKGADEIRDTFDALDTNHDGYAISFVFVECIYHQL